MVLVPGSIVNAAIFQRSRYLMYCLSSNPANTACESVIPPCLPPHATGVWSGPDYSYAMPSPYVTVPRGVTQWGGEPLYSLVHYGITAVLLWMLKSLDASTGPWIIIWSCCTLWYTKKKPNKTNFFSFFFQYHNAWHSHDSGPVTYHTFHSDSGACDIS